MISHSPLKMCQQPAILPPTVKNLPLTSLWTSLITKQKTAATYFTVDFINKKYEVNYSKVKQTNNVMLTFCCKPEPEINEYIWNRIQNIVVGSRPFSEDFSQFSSLLKKQLTLLNSNSIWDPRATGLSDC